MKTIEKYIVRNWFWISLACILQKYAVEAAYYCRGYKAVGGEWLVVPAVLFGVELIREILSSILETIKEAFENV